MVPVLVIYVKELLHHAASDREMPEREKSFAFICTDKIVSAYRTGVQVWNAITGAITRISRANIIAIITARSSWRCDINHTFERSVKSQWWRIPLIRALLIELISDSDFSASFTKRASRGIRRFIAVHRERRYSGEIKSFHFCYDIAYGGAGTRHRLRSGGTHRVSEVPFENTTKQIPRNRSTARTIDSVSARLSN